MTEDLDRLKEEELTLLEVLDHTLNRGLVISGDVTISVADVDLIFLGLNLLIGSVDTIDQVLNKRDTSATSRIGGDDVLPIG